MRGKSNIVEIEDDRWKYQFGGNSDCTHIFNCSPNNVKKICDQRKLDCVECSLISAKKKSDKKPNKVDGDDAPEPTRWMCLACAHVGCGRNDERHAIAHAEDSRQKTPHAVAVNLSTLQCWCYECDADVVIDDSLTFENIRQAMDTIQQCVYRQQMAQSTSAQNITEVTTDRSQDSKTPTKSRNRPIGLVNLGNTCFFNSVMQCLGATAPLREYMLQRPHDKEGAITTALRQFFKTIMTASGGQCSPSFLFSEIAKKAPRFKGYQQQDSQELLRHLMDGVNTEELARLGVKRQEDRLQGPLTFIDALFGGVFTSTVTCKVCWKRSTVHERFFDLSLPIPSRFLDKPKNKAGKGDHQAVAALAAMTLSAKEVKRERKSQLKSQIESTKLSGLSSKQRKNLEKAKKKLAKEQARTSKKSGTKTTHKETANSEDGDVEDDADAAPGTAEGDASETVDGGDVSEVAVGDGSETVIGCDTSANDGAGCDASGPVGDAPSAGVVSGTSDGGAVAHTPAGDVSEAAGDDAAQLVNRNVTDVADGDAEDAAGGVDTAVAGAGHAEPALAGGHSSNNIDNDGDVHTTKLPPARGEGDGVASAVCGASSVEGARGDRQVDQGAREHGEGSPCAEGKVPEEGKLNKGGLRTLLSKPPEKLLGQCSLLSCLWEFVSPEDLEGENMYNCAHCAKTAPQPSSSSSDDDGGGGGKKSTSSKSTPKKRVARRPAFKQFTLHTLPPVLTFHIKRFSQTAFGGMKKVSRHVDFPVEIDVAPFVHASRGGLHHSRGNNNDDDDDSRRDDYYDSDNDDTNNNNGGNKNCGHAAGHNNNGAGCGSGDTQAIASDKPEATPSGNPQRYSLFGVVVHAGALGGGHYTACVRTATGWWDVSDSHVRETTVESVLAQEAFLLFYLRE